MYHVKTHIHLSAVTFSQKITNDGHSISILHPESLAQDPRVQQFLLRSLHRRNDRTPPYPAPTSAKPSSPTQLSISTHFFGLAAVHSAISTKLRHPFHVIGIGSAAVAPPPVQSTPTQALANVQETTSVLLVIRFCRW
jgi:hypothetical protein